MNRLVEQLLRVARLDAVELGFSTVDLNKTATSVVATLAPWAIAQQRTIALVGTEKPVEVRANADAVEDALRNLIENAVVHTAAGTEVTVSVRREGCVEVSDRGPGVPRENREQIFYRFWHGRREVNDGAGLGLSIVKEIMRAHRGRVCVEDNPGGGALFGLHFSLV
jgi:signal transduction histidine kinase